MVPSIIVIPDSQMNGLKLGFSSWRVYGSRRDLWPLPALEVPGAEGVPKLLDCEQAQQTWTEIFFLCRAQMTAPMDAF